MFTFTFPTILQPASPLKKLLKHFCTDREVIRLQSLQIVGVGRECSRKESGLNVYVVIN